MIDNSFPQFTDKMIKLKVPNSLGPPVSFIATGCVDASIAWIEDDVTTLAWPLDSSPKIINLYNNGNVDNLAMSFVPEVGIFIVSFDEDSW